MGGRGGAGGVGGISATGGFAVSGGARATGGIPSAGAIPSAGGVSATGGTRATGGVSVSGDGGNIALTAQADTYTTAKWSGLLGSNDLSSIKVTDFEMVDGGARIPLTLDCTRTPLN